MAIVQTKVTIATVDRTSKLITYQLSDYSENEVSDVTLEFSKSITLPTIGQALTIQRNLTGSFSSSDYIFQGEITNIDQKREKVVVVAKDKLYNAVKAEITRVFDKNIDTEAGNISEIFKTLINDYTDLTADSTSVQDSGTTYVLDKFVCNHSDVYDKLQELANFLNWQFYYNPITDKVYFEPKGFTNYTTGLTVGSGGNILNIPIWKTDADSLVNYLTILGGETLIGKTETFTTNGSITDFQLSFVPVDVKVFTSTDNGATYTEKTGGVLGSTATYDYTVDRTPEVREIIFTSPPSASTPGVKVEYTYNIPVAVAGKRQTSIDSYGQVQRTLQLNDIRTNADAIVRLNTHLDKYSEPFRSTMLNVSGSILDIKPGYLVSVNDTKNNVTGSFAVNKVVYRYPHSSDEVYIGDREVRTADFEFDILKKIKQIQDALTGTQTQVTSIFSLDHSIRFKRKTLTGTRQRVIAVQGVYDDEIRGVYDQVYYENPPVISFILSSPIGGLLGTHKLGLSASAPSAITFVSETYS